MNFLLLIIDILLKAILYYFPFFYLLILYINLHEKYKELLYDYNFYKLYYEFKTKK